MVGLRRIAGFPKFVSQNPCVLKVQESDPSVEGEYLGICAVT